MSRRVLAVGALAGVVALALPALARAESCSYDGAARAVSASITPGGTAVLNVVGGELRFGTVPAPCGGATTANTDSVFIAGSVGTTERLTLDQRTGLFGPGFTSEFNIPEIEIATSLGDSTDTVALYLTSGDDFVAPGQNGLALNSDGDVDVTFSPGAFPMEIYALEGKDYVNGRGEGGAGLHFLGPLVIDGGPGDDSLIRGSSASDVLTGGAGDDRIDAQESSDVVDGGPGSDVISSGSGDDSLVGGSGTDSFAASDGNDTIYASDDEADTQINGGPGTDTAYYDVGLDVNPTAVENKIGDPPPPPPPTGPCSYNEGTRAVTAQIAAGEHATLVLSGSEIWFGVTPAVCIGATTLNTDTINVVGPSGSSETLTIDQSAGPFAPGATAESGTSEIEIATSLGDASDRVVVVGTAGDDSIAAGQNGVALNADTDVEVTFLPLPALIEIGGGGGLDTLSGRGGQGAGAVYGGRILLDGGDEADVLRGGLGADELRGGSGTDLLEGREGTDVLAGGAGADTLAGGAANDELTGEAGADSYSGSDGDDVFHAADGEADTQLNGGPGTDTAFYDGALDATPTAVENRFPA